VHRENLGIFNLISRARLALHARSFAIMASVAANVYYDRLAKLLGEPL
jgi:hypothetical protein